MHRAHGEVLYTTYPLGHEHYPADMNNHGEIAGEFRGTVQGGIFFDGTDWMPTGNAIPFEWSSLFGINDNHFAVGLATLPPQISETLVIHAVRVEFGTNIVNLGSLTGENGNASARAINNLNVAVGDSLNSDGKRRAVRFETNEVVTDLGTLGGDSSSAIDINDRGDITGTSQNAAGFTRGFFLGEDGIMRDIGTLGGDETFVTRMNARGDVVGSSKTASGAIHAFLYTGGTIQDLGTLGGASSAAYGINDHGVIVGMSEKQAGPPTAFIKYPGEPMIDLGALAKVQAPDVLISAGTINNRGLITVRGRDNGSNYLLKPGALTLEVRDSTASLKFAAPANTRVILERSETLTNWTPISTNTITADPIVLEQPIGTAATFFRATILD